MALEEVEETLKGGIRSKIYKILRPKIILKVKVSG